MFILSIIRGRREHQSLDSPLLQGRASPSEAKCDSSGTWGHYGRSQFVEDDSDLTDLTENVIFGLVRYVGGEVLAHDAVPVRRILLVKHCLHVLGDVLLCVFLVHDQVHLLLELLLHLVVHLADDVVNDSFSAHFSFSSVCWKCR